MVRTIILGIGWPVLVIGSVYLIVSGGKVYKLLKGSLVGRVTKVLVISMLVGMYSLGAIATFYMFADEQTGVWVSLVVFGVWFITFVWSLRVLHSARKETEQLTGGSQSAK